MSVIITKDGNRHHISKESDFSELLESELGFQAREYFDYAIQELSECVDEAISYEKQQQRDGFIAFLDEMRLDLYEYCRKNNSQAEEIEKLIDKIDNRRDALVCG